MLNWHTIKLKGATQKTKPRKGLRNALPIIIGVIIIVYGLKYAIFKRYYQALYLKNPSIAITSEKVKFHSDELLLKEYQFKKYTFDGGTVYIPKDYVLEKEGKHFILFYKCDQIIYCRKIEEIFTLSDEQNILLREFNKKMVKKYRLSGEYGFFKDVYHTLNNKYNRENYIFLVLKEILISGEEERLGKLEKIYDFQIDGKEGLLKIYRKDDNVVNFCYILKDVSGAVFIDFVSNSSNSPFDIDFTKLIISKMELD